MFPMSASLSNFSLEKTQKFASRCIEWKESYVQILRRDHTQKYNHDR
jgi:hypothetical protein